METAVFAEAPNTGMFSVSRRNTVDVDDALIGFCVLNSHLYVKIFDLTQVPTNIHFSLLLLLPMETMPNAFNIDANSEMVYG